MFRLDNSACATREGRGAGDTTRKRQLSALFARCVVLLSFLSIALWIRTQSIVLQQVFVCLFKNSGAALTSRILQGNIIDIDLFLFCDLRNTDGQGQVGDLGDIVIEETSVGNDGVVGQGLDTGTGVQGRTGLVEGNVTIGTDTAQEELDAANRGDLLLIALALEIQISCVSVKDVDVLGEDINVLEEVAPHERVVRLGVVSR